MDVAASSLPEIRAYLESRKRIPARVADQLAEDSRTGVQALLASWKERREQERRERRRLRRMLATERRLWGEGLTHVAGVDEAGVGPLAGPVIAAAVVFPPRTEIAEIDDSKRLDPELRDRLEQEIRGAAADIGIGAADVAEIDALNVYHAALLAMQRAISALGVEPQHVLVDAREIPGLRMPQQGVNGGDRRHFSIAAASIIAKTHRDRLMLELDQRFPHYGFGRHKGYCTPEHQEAIRRHGPCPAHRRSYTFVQELAGECSAAYAELKARIEQESSPEELAAIHWDFRTSGDLTAGERRKLQQLLSRHRKKYPTPQQLLLL